MRAGKGSGTDGGDYGKNAKCIPSQHWKNILNKCYLVRSNAQRINRIN